MNDMYYNAGLRIRELREMNRYTREQFAEIVDISPKFLYEIETGQKGFSADTLYRIARGLSVSCGYILSGEEHEYSEQLAELLGLFNAAQLSIVENLLKLIYELGAKNE